MHPDRKIGFALGILLVGIVAALFFRNEPLQPESVRGVRRETQLNQRLRDRDVAVYMDSQDGQSGEDSPQTANSPRWTLPELVEDLTQRNHATPAPIAGTANGGASQAAEPIDDFRRPLPPFTTNAAPETADVPKANEGGPQTEIAEFDFNSFNHQQTISPSRPVPDPVESAGNYDEYVVEYGDTLSDIAERFLGSSNRYSEIYDANRDRLSGPDQLRVGKAIRIPRF